MAHQLPTGANAETGHAAWARLIGTLTVEGDPESLFSRICHDVAEGFGFSRALLATVDPQRSLLAARGGHDPAISPRVYSALLSLYRVPLEPDPEGKYLIAPWCVAQREQVWIRDASRYDFRTDQTRQPTLLIKALGVREYVLTPIVSAGRGIGMLGVDKRGQKAGFNPAELELLRSVCELISWRLGPRVAPATATEAGAPPNVERSSEEADTGSLSGSEAGFVTSVLDVLDEGLLLLSAEGRVRYGNRAALGLLEAYPWEVSGKPLHEVLSASCLDELLAGIEAGGARPLLPLRGRLQRPSAGHVEVELRLVAVGVGAERAWGLVIRNLEEQGALRQLRDYSLAMLVHDLRAPLQSMIGFAELLRLGRMGAVNLEQVDFLRRIEESGEGMLGLIGKAFEVSDLESLAPGRREPVQVGPMVEGVLRQLGGKAAVAVVLLENEVPRDFPPLVADRDRLVHVFQNLVDNAIDASRQGGGIRVSGRATVRDRTPVAEFQVLTERVRLKGDTPSRMRRFGRRGPAGLGLTIARLVIQAHGGDMWVEDLAEDSVAVRFIIPFGPSQDLVTAT